MKRQAIIVDEENWPLSDVPTPRLSFSSSLSSGSVDRLMPPQMGTTNMNRDALLLPGFHFSTSDESADPAEFHRMAAQLLGGEPKDDLDEQEEEDDMPPSSTTSSHLHCDLGRDLSGRYCCSCGKSYYTALSLTEHVQQCAGVDNYPCHICDKIFSTSEKLGRHIHVKHNDDMEPCPECGIKFPSSYLPKHLATGLGGCDGTLQSPITIQLEKESAARQTLSERYWTVEGDHSWQKRRAHDSGYVADETEEIAEQTMSFVTRLLQRPVSTFDKVFCDLCGEGFWSGGDALAEHIGQHSLDFSEKRHKCDDCRVFFANEKDLNRHLQSATLTQHCGFTFRHNSNCTGHHPPTYTKSAVINDHALMQKHLWSWELSQFRTHRVAVATILAETLNGKADPHMSLADCKRTYASMLPHFAAANPQSRWSVSERDSIDIDLLDKHFSRVIDDIEAQRAITAAQLEFNSGAMYSDRPDSGVILQATRISYHRHQRSNSGNSYKPSMLTAWGENIGSYHQHARSISSSSNLSVPPTLEEEEVPEVPTNLRTSSIRKSLLRTALRRSPASDDATTIAEKRSRAHKRQAMSASGFALLRSRAEAEERPTSAPVPNMRVTAAC